MRLGFIGAGRMGYPMVRRLLGHGHKLRVLARSATTRDQLEADGALAVGDPAAVGESVDGAIVCVHTDEQVREACLDSELLTVLPEGSVLVVHTTGSPHTVDDLATAATARGVDVLDAPVSGGPQDIAAGALTLLVGGAEHTVTRIRPALESYGDPVLHLGALGTGQRVKLLNNSLFAAHVGLLAEAVRLGDHMGIAEPALLEALGQGSAASRALTSVISRESVAGFAASVSEFLGKDVAVARQVAAELDSDLGAIENAIGALP